MIKNLFTLVLILLTSTAFGQTYRFNQFTSEDGIAQDFIYSINQDKQGYLWIGTGDGLSRYDGKTFKTFTENEGLSENVILCSYKDENGVLWYGHNNGSISNLKNGIFQIYRDPNKTTSSVNAIAGINGEIYFVTQNDGLFKIEGNSIKKVLKLKADAFYSLEFLDADNLLIGTMNGMYHLKKEEGKFSKKETYLKNEKIQTLKKSGIQSHIYVGTNKGTLRQLILKNGRVKFINPDTIQNFKDLNISSVLEDKESNIWIGTNGQGLVRLNPNVSNGHEYEKTVYYSGNGLPTDFIQTLYVDREGNVWIGTFGQGLASLVDDFFTFYSHDPNGIGNDVSAVFIDDNYKYFGVENGLIQISPLLPKYWEFYNSENGFVDDKVTALYQYDSILWIGTKTNGLFRFDPAIPKMEKINLGYGLLQNKINDITGDSLSIWIATEGGMIIYNRHRKSSNLFDTESGLPHNAISAMYLNNDGTIWMGTHSRFIYNFQNYSIDKYEIRTTGELEVMSINKDENGNLWIATAASGVYRFDGEEFTNYSLRNGLKSNYTYVVHPDNKGHVWVGHRGALSKINLQTEEVTIYDHKDGINFQINQNAMFLDNKNYLWIGSDGGAIKYDPSKDVLNDIAPTINLTEILIGDKSYNLNENIELPYGNYRIHFEFIGINLKNPEQLTYKYKLNGHEEDFSLPTSETATAYSKISDGEYSFEVTACNEYGTCSTETAKVNISIAAPFWKKWWFYMALVFFIVGVVILIIRYRVRKLKEVQAYLEYQLDIKTKDVVEKAKKIEEINEDLTASINYASRIQNSILPDLETLKSCLPNSFVFYEPRDIVSGDFYFTYRIEDVLIVACVDCTGHGVPGAFVSMIGSTALRNIYSKSKFVWNTPDKVLEQLDKEVKTLLQQENLGNMTQEELFMQSRDGMDLTLVEINLKTREVLLASAMRTSLIRKNGQLETISGDKRSIGGENIRGIDYSVQHFQMNEGDELFLFSDGFTDQFGGPNKRKLKLSGTKDWIEGLSEMDRDQYKIYLAHRFNLWKKDVPQTDDVLLIGLMF